METIIKNIKDVNKNKKIKFDDKLYVSKDGKTIMGEVKIGEILFLEYRDTDAGSNPREYYGLKKTNIEILKSILAHRNMFRFLHSGLILSLSESVINEEENSINYDECCLTNGNQTRFLILILTLAKLFCIQSNLNKIEEKKYREFVKNNFEDNPRIFSLVNSIKFVKVNEIVDCLLKNTKYLNEFNEVNIKDFLATKIRIQINLLDQITSDLKGEKLDNFSIGSLIAEANNDTQNVKVDDIFGNKYKRELADYLFGRFKKVFKEVAVEYRMGEIADKNKVHILTLLRPVIALGLLTKEKDIFEYTNQRAIVYKLFEKLLRDKEKNKKTIDSTSKLIPLLYKIRTDYVIPQLEMHRRNFAREYTAKAVSGDLYSTVFDKQILSAKGDEKEIRKIIERNINYNIEHIMPVLIYRIRKLFKESEFTNDGVELVIVDEQQISQIFKGLTETLYKKYIDLKLQGLPSSLTTVVRSADFYSKGEEAYIVLKSTLNFTETDYIDRNKRILVS